MLSGTPVKPRGPNPYAQYVKAHFADVKRAMPHATQKEVMAALGQRWQEEKGAPAGGNLAGPVVEGGRSAWKDGELGLLDLCAEVDRELDEAGSEEEAGGEEKEEALDAEALGGSLAKMTL